MPLNLQKFITIYIQHMGNSTFHPVVALLRYKRKNEEAIMLTNVTPPPRHYVILTLSSLFLVFIAKARLLISAWFHRQPCTLTVSACRTQDNYKI